MKHLLLIALVISFAYPDKFIDQMLKERKAREYKEESKKIHKQNKDRFNAMFKGKNKIIFDYINKDIANNYNRCLKINNMKNKKLKVGKAFARTIDRECYEYAIRRINNNQHIKRIKKDMNIKVSEDTINLSVKSKKKKKFKLTVSD